MGVENRTIARIEDRLARLSAIMDELSILSVRLGQISHRAPYLEALVDPACAGTARARALAQAEFDAAKRERNGGE